MRQFGRIVRLQVQLDSIKTGKKPHEQYTPSPNLVSVDALRLNADGVIGLNNSGEHLPDVHNASHPHSKFRGENGISIGFTSHYRAMREQFGDHLIDGIAGENILVESDSAVALEDIEGGLVFVGDDRRVSIPQWQVAHPCNPFSKFCLQFPLDAKPDRRITEALQFLEHGMRGFIAVYPHGDAELRVGDVVYLAT